MPLRDMSFTSRDTAAAADILNRMIKRQRLHDLPDHCREYGCSRLHARYKCRHGTRTIWWMPLLPPVHRSSIWISLKHWMIKHLSGFIQCRWINSWEVLYIDRIYDTYIDEEELQACDMTVTRIADSLEPRRILSTGVYPGRWQYTWKRIPKRKIRIVQALLWSHNVS